MNSFAEIMSLSSIPDSIFAALLALFAGVIATTFANIFDKNRKTINKEIETIAETYVSNAKEAKSRVAIEALKNNPELAHISSAGGDINITIQNTEGSQLNLSADPLVKDLVNGYHQQALSQHMVGLTPKELDLPSILDK